MKYEYTLRSLDDLQRDPMGKLNKLGEQGWELCGIDGMLWVFKRQLPMNFIISDLVSLPPNESREL